MAKLSSSSALAAWFEYLRDFQTACSFNTNVPGMDLLSFANATIATILPSNNEKNQFIASAGVEPGFDISLNDLNSSSTFEALLDRFSPLPTFVGAYLQNLAAAPFPSGALADFFKSPTASAFPGGSTGAQWKTAVGRLSSVMPSVCFTAALQTKASQTIDSSKRLMSDVINEIAVLG